MAEQIGSAVAEKLTEYAVDPIWRRSKYLIFYKNKIRKLKNVKEDLENMRIEVQAKVDTATRNAEVIKPRVLAWLQKVDDLMERVEDVLKVAEIPGMESLSLRYSKLKTCYSLGRNATKMIAVIFKLQVEGSFERVSYPPPSGPMPNQTPHRDFQGFETRISTKKEILEALKDKDISIIGICGMPGVGKTTMVNEIEAQVKDEKLFDEVAMAVVFQEADIIKIQDQLAEKLDLRIEEKTESGRAQRLYRRLTHENKRVLLILDDVWKEIDLGTIGIPLVHDRKGLKILFTTRNEDVCRDMGAQRKYEVKVLSEQEGWQLFKHAADISDYTTEVEGIATEIAKECRGLPLALVTVGKALKNKMPHKWRDALQQLQNSRVTNLKGMRDLVYSRIELSYKYLESDEARSLLLLCSLFAEDQSISIECLVRYARGLELFQNTETLSQTRDRVNSIVDDLKLCYLLSSSEGEEEVKLHDVIRDFCLMIASKDKPGYLVKHVDLKEWPKNDNRDSYSAISLTFGELDELPCGFKYGNLELLRVRCNLEEQNICKDFFDYIQELRVLDFSWMNIQLPSSIDLLRGLQTLCLDYCDLMRDISIIGSLKKLEILTFYHSCLYVYFPREMAELRNLRSLDLRFQIGPHLLPPHVLLGMKKLEELYLGNYFKASNEEHGYIIEEISSLTDLNTFQISTDDTQFLMQILQGLCLDKLKRFEIILSKEKGLAAGDYHVRRRLDLLDGIDASLLLQPGIDSLMKRTDHLYIVKAAVWKNLVSELDEDGFINLKKLKLSSCDFEYLIDATRGTFGYLEILELRGLYNMRKICNENLSRMEHYGTCVPKTLSFGNLKVFEILNCDEIRSMFSESVSKRMVNLQSLYIHYCPMLEEVVSKETQENEATNMLGFPKLEKVTLQFLSKFQSFTSQSDNVAVRQTLFNQVTLPNMEMLDVRHLDCIVKLLGNEEMPITSKWIKLRDLTVMHCGNLVTIAHFDSIKLLQNLERFYLENCREVEVLFDFEDVKVNEGDAEVSIFGRLNSLEISTLPKLMQITRMVSKGICVFQNLTSFQVSACGSLKYLFPHSMVNSLVALENLLVYNCEVLESIIGREDESSVADMLAFPKLKELKLQELQNFKSFTSESDSGGVLQTLFNKVTLLNLEELNIGNFGCTVKILYEERQIRSLHRLRQLSVEFLDDVFVLFDFEGPTVSEDQVESVLGRLNSLKLEGLPKLVHITRMVPKRVRIFQNLASLQVSACDNLRYLFSQSIGNSLVALESLRVHNCEALEGIIRREDGSLEVQFPKLKELKLLQLKSFKSFESEPNSAGALQPLFNQSTLPNLEEFNIGGLDVTIKILYEARHIRSLHKLRKLSVELLIDVHILLDFDSLMVTEDRVESLLGRLNSLKILNLPKLAHITWKVPKGICVFKNLTSLDVGKCGSLRYLFSPSMANSLVALESLEVVDCEAIEEIIGRGEEEEGTSEIEMVEERMMNKIVFPKLYSLQLKNLERFRLFSSQNCKIVFPSLDKLEIRHCPVMNKFWLRQLSSLRLNFQFIPTNPVDEAENDDSKGVDDILGSEAVMSIAHTL